MNTTKVGSSGARRAGAWQMLALFGVLVYEGAATFDDVAASSP